MSKSDQLLRFACHTCTARLTATRRRAGTRGRCPWCQTVFTVPAESTLPVVGETYAVADREWRPEDSERIETYIAVTCPLCRTRMVATTEQAGEQLVCPDCGTRSTVPPPPVAQPEPEKKPSEPADIYSIFEGEGQPPANVKEVHQTYVPVVCGLCRTRMLATEDQVGQPITCPDCGTTTLVPPSAAARPEHDPAAGVGEEYSLCAEPGQPPSGSVAYEEQYAVRCPVCQTRLYATPQQAGKKITCPDCRRDFIVPPPSARKPATPTEPTETYDIQTPEQRTSAVFEVFRPEPRDPLPQPRKGNRKKPPVEKPPVERTHDAADAFSLDDWEVKPEKPRVEKSHDRADALSLDDWKVKPEKPRVEKSHARADPPSTADRKAKGKKPRVEEPVLYHERPKLPRHPFLSGVFNFPWYSSVWVFWAFLSLGLGLVFFLAGSSIQLAMGENEGTNYFVSMFLAATGAVLFVLVFVPASAHLLAIVGESSEGADQIAAWPDAVFLDWCLQCFYVIVAGGIALVAGTIAGGLVSKWGLTHWLAIELGTLLVFPIALLSLLESGSPMMPISLPVLHSLIGARGAGPFSIWRPSLPSLPGRSW